MSYSPDGKSGSEPPAGSVPQSERSEVTRAARLGQQVGRYILLKAVGQGGMGVVYAAYDPELDRKVALKLLHPGGRRWDRAQARARLQREAQAMARISHPHVIPVFDVGTHEDQVFVAMEFVEGGTLSEWMKGEHTWREVLEVYLQAGRGLEAAHAAGLVHRDFKPANVLLSRNGRVYVTDFGLARPVESLAQGQPETGPVQEPTRPAADQEPTLPGAPQEQGAGASEPTAPVPASFHLQRRSGLAALTQADMIVGTPAYMPPEQYMGGPQDARSDQFSFCAALYWALYKQRPFDHQRLREAAESSQGTDVSERLQSLLRSMPPSPWVREPPREAKVPAWVRRVVMKGLELDPQRRYASMGELLEQLSQEPRRVRQRQGLVAGGVALAVLAVAGGVAWRQGQVCAGADRRVAEVWGPAQRQRLQGAFAATGSRLAASAAERVGQVLDGYAQGWVRQRTEACEATRRQGVQSEELLARREVCLERRRKDLGALVRVLAEADAKLVEKAVEVAQGLPDLGECADVEALANQQSLPADPARREEVEQLGEELADVRARVDAGRYKEVLERVQQLEPRVEATHWLPLRAEARYHLGWSQQRLGDKEAAQKSLLQALYLSESAGTQRLKINVLLKLLFNEGQMQRFTEADQWGLLAEAALERMGGEPLLASDVAVQRGWLEMTSNRFEEAQRHFQEGLKRMDEAGLPPVHVRRNRAYYLQGLTALRQEDYPRAVEGMQRALEQTEATLGREHPSTVLRYAALAAAQREAGDLTGALNNSRQALEVARAVYGAEHVEVAFSLEDVGAALARLKRYGEAVEAYRGALEMKQKLLGPKDARRMDAHLGLGKALVELGQVDEGVEQLEQGLGCTEGAQLIVQAEAEFALGKALWAREGERARALRLVNQARQHYLEDRQAKHAAEVEEWLKSTGAP